MGGSPECTDRTVDLAAAERVAGGRRRHHGVDGEGECRLGMR